jgi:hypothetical protein
LTQVYQIFRGRRQQIYWFLVLPSRRMMYLQTNWSSLFKHFWQEDCRMLLDICYKMVQYPWSLRFGSILDYLSFVWLGHFHQQFHCLPLPCLGYYTVTYTDSGCIHYLWCRSCNLDLNSELELETKGFFV